MSLTIVSIFLLMFAVIGTNAYILTMAKNLTSTLLTGYNKELRPVYFQYTNVSVSIDMYLISIKDFDEVSGTLNVVAVFVINWYDQSLIWDPAQYGIYQINIGQNNIWLPKLYNIKVSNSFLAISDSNLKVRINSDGSIYWQPGGLIDVKCNPDVSYFPFDTQKCSIQFAAWGYVQHEVVLKPSKTELTLDFYETNGEWSLDSTVTGSYVLSDMSLAVFNITISRLPAFHIVNTLMPVFLLLFMNPLVFLLPCDSGERVGFSLTVFLTFTVFITVINSVLPANSESMSRLSYFIFVVLVASGIIASINIFQLRMYYRDENTKVPRWLVRLVRFLSCQCKSSKNNVKTFCPENGKRNLAGPDEDKVGHLTVREHSLVDAEITWKDVVQVTDIFYTCFFYVAITVASIVILVSMAHGHR